MAARAPDLLYSETEQDLRESLRALLKSRCRPEDVLGRIATLAGCGSGDDGEPGNPEPYDTGLWHQIAADMGCAGLLVPEKQDGAGASFREAATVAEELGQAVAPVPYIGSAIVATTALLSAGDDAVLRELARRRRHGRTRRRLRGRPRRGVPAHRPGVRAEARRWPRWRHPAARPHPGRGRRAGRRHADRPGRRRSARPVCGRRGRRRCAAHPGALAGHDPPAVRYRVPRRPGPPAGLRCGSRPCLPGGARPPGRPRSPPSSSVSRKCACR